MSIPYPSDIVPFSSVAHLTENIRFGSNRLHLKVFPVNGIYLLSFKNLQHSISFRTTAIINTTMDPLKV